MDAAGEKAQESMVSKIMIYKRMPQYYNEIKLILWYYMEMFL